MIVVDASVVIAHVSGDSHSAEAFEILDTEEVLAVHPLTQAEILAGPARIGRELETLQAMQRLGIEVLHPTEDEPLQLARVRAKTGLKLPDCCVFNAAEQTGSQLATFDRKLAAEARKRGLDVLGA